VKCVAAMRAGSNKRPGDRSRAPAAPNRGVSQTSGWASTGRSAREMDSASIFQTLWRRFRKRPPSMSRAPRLRRLRECYRIHRESEYLPTGSDAGPSVRQVPMPFLGQPYGRPFSPGGEARGTGATRSLGALQTLRRALVWHDASRPPSRVATVPRALFPRSLRISVLGTQVTLANSRLERPGSTPAAQPGRYRYNNWPSGADRSDERNETTSRLETAASTRPGAS